jgi:hypothetical protein
VMRLLYLIVLPNSSISLWRENRYVWLSFIVNGACSNDKPMSISLLAWVGSCNVGSMSILLVRRFSGIARLADVLKTVAGEGWSRSILLLLMMNSCVPCSGMGKHPGSMNFVVMFGLTFAESLVLGVCVCSRLSLLERLKRENRRVF